MKRWKSAMISAFALLFAFAITSCDKEEYKGDKGEKGDPGTGVVTPVTLYATVSGRTLMKTGTSTTDPLSDATIYSYYSGAKQSTTSDSNGFWTLSNIPMSDSVGNNTIRLYFEKEGWSSPSSITVSIGGVDDAHQGGYNVTIAEVTFEGLELMVTSNVIHGASTNKWLSTGASTTDQDIYLADSTADITLTFNMPVDTTYTGTAFVELLDSSGDTVSFSGSWDTTKMIFTVNPTAALTADNKDDTEYRLRFIHNVRAFNGASELQEMKDVQIVFDVLSSGAHDTLLASQAPSLMPQADDYTSYVFDAATAFYKKLVDNGTVDFSTTGTSVKLTWSAVTNAASYNLYFRNSADNEDGEWTKSGASQTTLPDGSIRVSVNPYTDTNAVGTDNVFKSAETVEYVVTAVDADGNESSIGEVTSPLVISDTYGPTVSSRTYSGDSRLGNSANVDVSGDLTVTFSENMNTTSSTVTPTLTVLSGLISVTDTTSDNAWTSSTKYTFKDIKTTFTVSGTTLAFPARSGDSGLQVASVQKFMVGDTILIYDASEDTAESKIISSIDSANNLIGLTATISKDFTSGSMVYLKSSGTVVGLSQLRTTLSSDLTQGDTTVDVASATGIAALATETTTLTVYSLDDGGSLASEGTLTVSSVSGTTLTFSSPAGFDAASGSIVLPTGNSTSIPSYRNAVSKTLAAESTMGTVAASTTVTAAQEGQDTSVVVADTTGFAVGDRITIGATSVTDLTEADLEGGTTTLTLTGHSFVANDKVRILGENVSATLIDNDTTSDNNTSILAGSTTLKMSQLVVVGDSITVTDAKVETNLSAAVASGGTSLSVASTNNLAIGDTITLNDGQNSENVTISGISGTTLTVGAVSATLGYAADTVVTKAAESETKTVTTDNGTSTSSTVTVASFTNSFSDEATVVINRSHSDYTVNSIATNTITLSGSPTGYKSGATIQLISIPEVRTVTAVDFDKITFSSALNFSHHIGATVSTSATKVIELNTWSNSLVVGDTIVIDTDQSTTTVNDRFSGTVTAIDSTNKLVTISTTKTGTIPATANVYLMGDAFVIGGAADSNGNSMQTSYGNRMGSSVY